MAEYPMIDNHHETSKCISCLMLHLAKTYMVWPFADEEEFSPYYPYEPLRQRSVVQ